MKKVVAGVTTLAVIAVGYTFWPTSETEESNETRVSFEGERDFKPADPSSASDEAANPSNSKDRPKSAGSQNESSQSESEKVETEIRVLGVEEVDRENGEVESTEKTGAGREPESEKASEAGTSDDSSRPRTLRPETIDKLHRIQTNRNPGLPETMAPVNGGEINLQPANLPDPKNLNDKNDDASGR